MKSLYSRALVVVCALAIHAMGVALPLAAAHQTGAPLNKNAAAVGIYEGTSGILPRALTTAITDTASLRTAVTDFCNDAVAATITYGHISTWDTSGVVDMSNLFYTYCSTVATFDEDITAWDVGQVTNMEWMFWGASAFNQDLGVWDVSQVTTMFSMLYYASAFDQDLGAWDVGLVTTMYAMFYFAPAFDQDLGAWNVGLVTDMGYMFHGASAFAQTLCWDLTGKTITSMFISSSGSADTTQAKCNCGAGTYYTGAVCASCPAGQYSPRGKLATCFSCPTGEDSPQGASSCFVSPTPAPTPAPTAVPTAVPIALPTSAPTAPGTCIHASSTVTVLADDNTHRLLRVSDLKSGQFVLAAGASRALAFSEVVGLPHSPSDEDFIKVDMVAESLSASSKHGLLATLHHTFPMCSGDKAVKAMDLKPGDCLHTVTGKGIVESAVLAPAVEGDVTYSIELKDADLVAVGGVFTHAKMMAHAPHEIGQVKAGANSNGKLKTTLAAMANKERVARAHVLAASPIVQHHVAEHTSKAHPSLRSGLNA